MILQPVNDDVVITQIIDVDSGEKIESFMRLPALTNPQQLGSAISYYRRYSLVSLLTLASTDDDGAEAAKNIPQKKPAISETGFTKALTAIAEGRYTKEDLMTNYSLTTDQLAQL